MALAMIAGAPAMAQDTATTSAPTTLGPDGQVCVDQDRDGACDVIENPSTSSQPDGADTITVVGSRIRRDQFNSADPIQVITRDESTQAGFNSTAEVLQSTKVTGGTEQINDSFGGFVVDGGPGVNTLSLRGLGATRTLILLNGRRVSPAGSRGAVGSADLNVLPNAIIDRIEVLNTGASSIYGSDAVAGVVNVVTRRDLNGVEFSGQHNFSEDGAGNSRRYSLSAGYSGERLRLAGSLEYFKRDRLTIGDREFSRCPTSFLGTNGSDFGAGDFIDPETGLPKCFPLDNGGVTVNTIATPGIPGNFVELAPGVPAGYTGTCNRFRPRAGAGGFIPGYECVGGGNLSLNIRDTFSPSLLAEDIISPAEIYTGFAQASYELGTLGNAEIYTELLVNRRKSNQNGQRQFTLDYPVNSPLIPDELDFGVPILNPTPTSNGQQIGIRVFADYGIYNNRQTVDFVRWTGGLRGDLGTAWRYDLFLGKAWSDSDYTTDLILTDRLARSFDVVRNPDGTFSCRQPLEGCVAAPVITPELVGGQFPQAFFDYVTAPVTGTTKFRETTFAANVDGPIFELPAGKVQVALGAEYRKSRINDTPGEDSQNNNLFGFTSSTPTRGSDSVWEVFGELELPLVRDSFLHDFTINASARYTEYESYGGQETWKVGALLAPVRGLTFRGSYGTSYRAPALFEQFLGRTTGFLSSNTDPCDGLEAQDNPLIIAQCRADGVPADFVQRNGVTVIGVGGAEAGLRAETSKALTFGGVLEPDFGEDFGSLSLAVDYFRVKINNGVARLTGGEVLSQCYENPERTTCGLVSRDANNALTVISSYVNIADAKAEGIDYNVRYGVGVFGGQLRLNASLTQYLESYSRTFPTEEILNVVGLINSPEWSGQFDATYTTGPLTVRYSLEWLDGTDSTEYAEGFGFDPNIYYFKTDDYFLHTASANYDINDRLGFTLGVRNIFDTDPPRISSGYTNQIGNAPLYSGYDLRGRTFFVGINAKY